MIDYEVTLQGLAWVSERKGLPRSEDDTEADFIASEEWQTYLRRYRPDDMNFIFVVRDCQRLTIRTSGKDHVRVTISVPAEMFLGDESKQDVYRDIKMRAYTKVAEKFGWPPPPPLPPLTVKRTYRKNYQPPNT